MPTGRVAIPCSENSRHSQFWIAVTKLRLPQGWEIMIEAGSSIARNRNQLIRRAQKENAEFILFLDDDQTFTPDLLLRLLSHTGPKRDVISGLYCHRLYPNVPLVFDRIGNEFADDGSVYYRRLQDNEHGLIKVLGTGAGCLLVHMSVFAKLKQFCRQEDKTGATAGKSNWFTLGQIDSEEWSDDHTFFKYCRQAGIDVYVDLDTPVGHLSQVAIWPARMEDGKWEIMSVNNGSVTILPHPEFAKSPK